MSEFMTNLERRMEVLMREVGSARGGWRGGSAIYGPEPIGRATISAHFTRNVPPSLCSGVADDPSDDNLAQFLRMRLIRT